MTLTPEMVLRIDGILAAAEQQGRSTLYEHEVYGILQTIGLAAPRHRFVREVAEVTAEALAGLGRTVVVKIVSPGIPHKQKLGGVRKVAAAEPLYVRFVLTRMREEVLAHFAPGEAPEIAGFLLVEYVPHTQAIGYETLVGFREDPAFGPILTVSKGGDRVPLLADRGEAPVHLHRLRGQPLRDRQGRPVRGPRRPGAPAPGSGGAARQADGRVGERRPVLRGLRLLPPGTEGARLTGERCGGNGFDRRG